MNSSTKLPQIKTNEVSILFNPAFCAEILCRFIEDHSKTDGVDFPILFFVLPIVTHPKTIEFIPPRSKKTLSEIIKESPEIRFRLKDRILNFMPITKNALIFALDQNVIRINENGKWEVISRSRKKRETERAKIKEYFDLSGRFGKKCSIYDSTTIFYMLGIRP